MARSVDEAAIAQYITATFDSVDVVVASGNSFFFYEPKRDVPPDRKFPFATLVTNDEYDQTSNLNRPSVFRLNVGIGTDTFRARFGSPTSPSGTSGDAESSHDFTALDRLMPHPVYGRMHWVCVLNPSAETFERVRQLLAEAYARAARQRTKAQPDN